VGGRGGRVAEEGGDVDGVGGEVAEVEGVEVECWEMLLAFFVCGLRCCWLPGAQWVGLG
jgi:hypothetical protein